MSGLKPLFDLDHLDATELTALIETAQVKREEKIEEAKAALLAEFNHKAARLGISLKTLMSASQATPERKTHRAKGAKVSPKYRNPETGDTWTGRGREPGWIKGKNRKEFALNG